MKDIAKRRLGVGLALGLLGCVTLLAASGMRAWDPFGRLEAAPPERVASLQMPSSSKSFGSPYDLTRLDILESTLYYVEENYVEPSRVDWERMFVEALHAVEREVPMALFDREPGSNLLHVHLGQHRTTREVPPVTSRRQLQRELHAVASLLQMQLSPDDIPTRELDVNPYSTVEYALINGILSTLDPHSVLLPPEASKEMDVENQGEFGGLGITITEREGRLTVEYPLPDTPAERAGLIADDHIRRIDGESTINMPLTEAIALLRGPVGEPVNLEIGRGGEPEPLEVRVVRAKIKINPVETELLDGAIGYVSIKSFHAAVESDLHDGLTRLGRESGGLKGLILDLRGNPGGYLTQAVAVADAFLDNGMIVVQLNGAGAREGEELARAAGTEPKYPIVVLVNANSASASEIVAGALRNNSRAVVIGERTFGKGSVQNLRSFVDESKLKLTISKYLTPGDRSIQSVGIPADIQLLPTVAEWRDSGEGREPLALVYWRERVRREADLERHLEVGGRLKERPAYSLRYLRPAELPRHEGRRDLSQDFEVQFARDVLLSAPSWRRAEVLAAVAPLVERHRGVQEAKIEDAMQAIHLDWQAGDTAGVARFDVEMELGEDGVLHAGTRERVALQVTNRGDEPVHRLVAVSTSDNEALDGKEFVFGKLEAGETRRYEQWVELVDGYPSEQTPVTFTFRDGTGAVVSEIGQRVPVEGRPLPSMIWSWSLSDPAPGGDGDGRIEVGERVRVELEVRNVGEGATREAVARIENRSGKALDIVEGTLLLGECVGPVDPVKGRCERSIAAGDSWGGTFEVEVRDTSRGDLSLELSIGDVRAYDHASIVRGGFYDHLRNRDRVTLPVGAPVESVGWRRPPQLEITAHPGPVVDRGYVSLSGVATDDEGIAWVVVYRGTEKLFFDGSGRDGDVKVVPFTATTFLEPGSNTLTVVAVDHEGFSHTQSVVTFLETGVQHASVGEGL